MSGRLCFCAVAVLCFRFACSSWRSACCAACRWHLYNSCHPPPPKPHAPAPPQLLDVCAAVRPDYWELKEVSLFLAAPIDAAAAVGLYVKTGAGGWAYRGCVHNGRPSEVMPLQWPMREGGEPVAPQPGAVQIGVRALAVRGLALAVGVVVVVGA